MIIHTLTGLIEIVNALSCTILPKHLQSCSTVMLCHAIPLVFSVLQLYRPKAVILIGLIDNVPILCVELAFLEISRPS